MSTLARKVRVAFQVVWKDWRDARAHELTLGDRELSHLGARPLDPVEINDGWCSDFSADLAEAFRALGLKPLELDGGDLARGSLEGVHVWTYLEGRHYDAECEEGVEAWPDLPFWKRWRAAGNRIRRRDSVAREREKLVLGADLVARCRAKIFARSVARALS